MAPLGQGLFRRRQGFLRGDQGFLRQRNCLVFAQHNKRWGPHGVLQLECRGTVIAWRLQQTNVFKIQRSRSALGAR
jgi:hypothetical protein